MKSFILACIAATGFSQEEVEEVHTHPATEHSVDFLDLVSGNTTGSAVIGENVSTSTATNGDVTQQISLWTVWNTGGSKFEDGTWVMNYAQWESVMEPGKWTAVSCAAQWVLFEDSASSVSVKNYLGDTKFSELAAGDREGSLFENGLFEEADASNAYNSETLNYKEANTRKNKPERWRSSQACAVNALFYSTLNGEADNESLTNIYWAMKEAGQISIDTSFMLCDEQTCSNPSEVAELTSVDYPFFDFGFEKPAGQRTGKSIGNSAVYLTAAASALAALMAF